MTVDIARLDNNAAVALHGASDAMARLAQWVEAARNAHQLVAPLVDTAFVPDAYKPKVDPRGTEEQKMNARNVAIANATAAVLQGLTLGVDPLVALQQIYIIHGRPGMYAKFMVALVQAHGHEVWTEDLSDTRAVVCGRRKGSEHVERMTITMEMARRAKWTSNAKYQETPQDMLWARAAGRVCDRIASDVLKGITSVEEIQDTIQVQSTAGPTTRTVAPPKRATTPAPAIAAAPAPEPPLEAEPVAEPAPTLITQAQSKKLHTLLTNTGRGDRDEGLAYLAGVIGRDITTSKELTKAEAAACIDALENPPVEASATAADQDEPSLDDDLWPDTTPAGGEPQ
jgi:hypothetical protein